MSEAPVDPPNPRLAALAKAAAMLQWPILRVRDEAVGVLLAKAIDSVLASVSRGRGALDIAIGEHLDVLGTGDRVSVGDYAREMLGIRASTAQKMARFARRLRDCPLLAEAVRSGEVSVRQAEAVLPVARGEAEADWVARARKETVRALQAAVKDPSGRDPEEDEQWDRVCIDIPAAGRQRFDEAIALAGKALGANVPKWERLVVLCQECIGAHATPDGEASPTRCRPCPSTTGWSRRRNGSRSRARGGRRSCR
ncbi:MAG: hypothetical protein E6J58_05920 [Deltaproteobacteria bacterium]|nr:MAG: hypothetical protein E6J58_05920 [Deltaproteobacteria bacterium]